LLRAKLDAVSYDEELTKLRASCIEEGLIAPVWRPRAVARIMGTSAEMIDKTYGHLLPDSPGHIRGLLDAYNSRNGHLSDTGT
jgi:hypothetical protein